MKTAASYIKKKYDCYKDYSEQSIRDVCHIWCEVIEEAQNDVKKEYEERLRFIPVEEELPPKEEDSDESIIVLIQETQDSGNVLLGWYDYYQEKWFMVYRLHEVKPTHWRPIL